MSDDIGWFSAQCDGYFALTFVRGVTYARLAEMITVEPADIMDPDRLHRLEAAHRSWDLPQYALIGDTGTGWAFALESPAAPHASYRWEKSRAMRASHTVVSIESTQVDPPMVTVTSRGHDEWAYHWDDHIEDEHADHPITRRLIAEAGYVMTDDPDVDDDYEPPDIAVVYRMIAEHYGLALPRADIENRHLHAVFTEPRTFLHPVTKVPDPPYEPCPECGSPMEPWKGDGRYGSEYRLECVRRDDTGCNGWRSGPLVQTGTRSEVNPAYIGLRLP